MKRIKNFFKKLKAGRTHQRLRPVGVGGLGRISSVRRRPNAHNCSRRATMSKLPYYTNVLYRGRSP